jgi:hypothetical protein
VEGTPPPERNVHPGWMSVGLFSLFVLYIFLALALALFLPQISGFAVFTVFIMFGVALGLIFGYCKKPRSANGVWIGIGLTVLLYGYCSQVTWN